MFSISFLNTDTKGHPSAKGRLVLGSTTEWFRSSLGYWECSDYEKQWREALNHIVTSATKAALITSMENPLHANFISLWPMWRFENVVKIQEELLFLDEMQDGFQLDRLYDYVSDFQDVSEDGNNISTWTVEIEDIVAYLR